MIFAVVLGLQCLSMALMVGFMAVVEWSLVPAQNRLDGAAYTVLEQGMNRVLMRLTPTLMATALLTGVVATTLGCLLGSPGWPLLGIAAGGVGLVIISTLTINAPINSAINGWSSQVPPADWQEQRDRWELGHRVRAYVGLVALGALIVGAVLPLAG